MAKLQLIIEDELMKKLKLHTINQNTTIKEVVTTLLEGYFNHSIIESNDTSIQKSNDTLIKESNDTVPEPTYEKPKDPLDDLYYVFPKTFKVGPKAKQDMEKSTGGIRWALMQDCKSHFDSKGNLIPFRYTDENGIVIEPDEEELSYMSDVLGKAIRMED